MQIPIFTVDAFTNRPFSGNPAAVCLLENVSSCFGLRWFTPANEVPLCGHATLAAAAVLFHIQKNTNSILTFVTLSGELKARQVEDRIVLDLPLYSTYPQVLQEVEELIKAAVGDMIVQDLHYSPDTKKLLVRLSDAYERSVLEELQVSAQRFLSAEKTGKVKGLILTLKGNSSGKDKGHDFYSRYFAPWNGVLEDPVTGIFLTVDSCFHLAFQCSRRGGELKISLRHDGRVDIAGQIAIVLKGNLTF
ncbi:PBLD protein, partial [Corythaeola cristata]|nr:PBLD protein [Corythaeola cristata]